MTCHRFRYGLIIALFCLSAAGPRAWADLTINFIAVNASEDQPKKMEVKYALPKELEPEDILDPGELEKDYDVDMGGYYVHKVMTFQPKESRTFKVRVRDVWRITQEEVDVLKKQLDENVKLLEKDEGYEYAVRARDRLVAQLDQIFAKQASYSENIDRRIEEYRADKALLEVIRSNAYDLDYLAHEAKVLDELANQKNTVKFIVEVKNPTPETRTILQKHYLPKEVREEDVVDAQGFEVRFDEKKQQSYLTKEESFGPEQQRKYEVVIKDIWAFPLAKTDAIQKRADLALAELKDSIYEQSANFLFEAIQTRLTQIRQSAALELGVEQHIGMFRLNQRRYDEALLDCVRLEKMMSIVRAKRLEEMESGRVQNVLQRLKALRGLASLSEAIFKRGISVTMTWKIIFGTIIFVAFFTTLHFFIWSRRSKRMGEELGLKSGESIRVVPKPGEEKEEEG